MRVLFFINSLSAGGAERVTVNLANHWGAQGWEISLVTIHPIGCDSYALLPSIRRVSLDLEDDNRSMLWSLWQKMKTVWALRRELIAIKPDVAISIMTDANILLAISSLWLRYILLVGSERIYPPLAINKKRHWEWLRKHTYGRFDRIVALTSENEKWLYKHTRAKHIDVIPNPLIWPLPVFPPFIAPEEYLKPERKYLLAVGRLHPQKQFDLLIRVFKCLSEEYRDWDLVILGEGNDRSMLECLVSDLHLQDRISLPGVAGNLSEWYRHADAFVLSSAFEGFPNALLEAMAHGLPVVSFDCDTGPRDLIVHEYNGLLVLDGDANEMEISLRRLLSDKALRLRLGNAALEVRRRNSITRIAAKWEAMFINPSA